LRGKLKYEMLRRWEVDELRFREIVKVPTLKEKNEMGISDEEWIIMCFEAHEKVNQKCFREIFGHKICDFCPKRNL